MTMSNHENMNDEVKGAEQFAPASEGETPKAEPTKSPVEVLEQEVAKWKDQFARAQAEFENSRKRLQNRQAEAVKQASARVIKNMIPSLDDLEYAEKHAVESGRESEAKGIRAIAEKMLEAFKKEGVTVIDPLGKPFDHNCCNAVQMVTDPEQPDQTVVQVLQKGYELNGVVLRPAMVIVSTGGAPAK